MKPRVSMLAILLGVSVGLWLNFRPAPTPPDAAPQPPRPPRPTEPQVPAPAPATRAPTASSAAASVPPSAPSAAVPPPATTAASPAPVAGPTPASVATASAPAPAGEAEAVRHELEQAQLMLRDYRSLYGENPVGTNAEIMRALMGGNSRGATLGPFEGATLNGLGELVDRWGTPYFFHQLSRDRMEIISAGPDKKLFTGDDVR